MGSNSLPRIEPGSPASGARCLGHWITTEVLISIYFYIYVDLLKTRNTCQYLLFQFTRVHSCFLPFHETLFPNSEKHGSCYWLSQHVVTAPTVLSHILCLPHPTQAVRLHWAGPYVDVFISPFELTPQPWLPPWQMTSSPYLVSHLMIDSSSCCTCPSHSTQALTAQVELLACVDALFILCELILHGRHTHTHTHTGFDKPHQATYLVDALLMLTPPPPQSSCPPYELPPHSLPLTTHMSSCLSGRLSYSPTLHQASDPNGHFSPNRALTHHSRLQPCVDTSSFCSVSHPSWASSMHGLPPLTWALTSMRASSMNA